MASLPSRLFSPSGPWPDREPLSDRLPPQNLEAEMGTLGSVLLEPGKLKEVRAILRGPEDFFRDVHCSVYRTICDMADAGTPIDAISLADCLTRQGEIIEVGGIEYIAEIVNSVPHPANAMYYANIVRQKAVTRVLIDAASEVLRDSYSNAFTAEDLVSRAKQKLAAIEDGAGEKSWQPPDLDSAFPALPFPLDVFPVGLRRLADQVAESGPCPPDYFAVVALAVAGAAVGRSVRLRVKPGWYEEGNLWTAFIATPGTGKSPAMDAATGPLYRILEEQLRAHEGVVDAIKARKAVKTPGLTNPEETAPPLKQILLGDTTMEALAGRLRDNPRGVIICLDELAGLFSGMNQYKTGGNDEEALLSLWSRTSFPVNRKSQEGGVPIYVRSPFACFTGGIQPAKLKLIGVTKDGKRVNDGMMDRFLVSFPRGVPPRWTDQGVDPEALEDWGRAVRKLWSREMLPVDGDYDRPFLVDWTADARSRYVAWFNANCQATQESDFPEDMKGPYSKMRGYCARLALVLEMLASAFNPDAPADPRPVSLHSVESAIRLVGYFECHYRRVLEFMSGDDAENPDAEAVIHWLEGRDKPTFTSKQVLDNFRGRFKKKMELAMAALDWLEARGFIRKLPDRPSRRGRKPAHPTYETNPSLLERAREMREIGSDL